jgi:four helix bundle protein
MPINEKPEDPGERTFRFAVRARTFVRKLPRTVGNIEDVRQLVKASGSVAANYIEADESLSDKDFVLRITTCRKEAKESRLWLRLLDTGSESQLASERDALAQEARELMLIFNAIVRKKGGR